MAGLRKMDRLVMHVHHHYRHTLPLAFWTCSKFQISWALVLKLYWSGNLDADLHFSGRSGTVTGWTWKWELQSDQHASTGPPSGCTMLPVDRQANPCGVFHGKTKRGQLEPPSQTGTWQTSLQLRRQLPSLKDLTEKWKGIQVHAEVYTTQCLNSTRPRKRAGPRVK